MANGKIRYGGVHHIAIKASDFDRSFEFYTKGLGMTPVLEWGEGAGRAAMLDIGDGAFIELFGGGKRYEDAGAWMHVALSTGDTDGAYHNALAAGALSDIAPFDTTIKSKGFDQTVRIAFVKGPDNEILEFFQLK